jgi:hypothetical protein
VYEYGAVTEVGIEMFRIRPELTVIVWRGSAAVQVDGIGAGAGAGAGVVAHRVSEMRWYSPGQGQGRKDRYRRPCAMSMILSKWRPDVTEWSGELTPTHHDTVHWPH